MNAKPGGKQHVLRDTVWEGRVQIMVIDSGVPKGLIQVSKERGRYRAKMKLEEMSKEISFHPDFLNEKHSCNFAGYVCIMLPKLHCELNPMKDEGHRPRGAMWPSSYPCWAQAKRSYVAL